MALLLHCRFECGCAIVPLITREGKELWYREDVNAHNWKVARYRALLIGGLILLGGLSICLTAADEFFHSRSAIFGFLWGAVWAGYSGFLLSQGYRDEKRFSKYPSKHSGFIPPAS